LPLSDGRCQREYRQEYLVTAATDNQQVQVAKGAWVAEITVKRTGEHLRKLFGILLKQGEPMSARDALEQLANATDMTDYEAGIYESTGSRRFEKIVRFATVDCVKAGWLAKQKGQWSVTETGAAAYKKFGDPESFYREATRLYKVWRASHEPTSPSDVQSEALSDEVKNVGITFEQAEEQAWAELEQYIRGLDPFEVQQLVADLLKAMGYYVGWVSPPGKDGGVDIIAHTDPLGTRVPRIKVQVKRVITKVDVDGLKSFMAVINDDDVGLYVSTGGFTRDAEMFARSQERRKITLIDFERLVDLWVEFYAKLDDAARQRLPLTPIYFLTPRE
jgi:restriction system protein